MENRELEELELDFKELMFLLKEAKTEPTIIPIVKRHMGRFTKAIEDIGKKLDQCDEVVAISYSQTTEPTIIEEDSTKTVKQSVTIEEEVLVSPEINKTKIEIRKEKENTNNKASSTIVLGEQLKPAAELSKGLSLNDRFRFSRELFNNDKDAMSRILLEISTMDSLDEVISYLSVHMEWDEENDAVNDFVELLKKYFV